MVYKHMIMAHTLTLSGWTQPANALLPAVGEGSIAFDYSDYAHPEASFAALAEFADVPNLIAWSMGGQLALRAMAAGVLRPRHVTLISVPYQFVQTGGGGMDPLVFDQFRANYASNPTRTKTRFHGLVAKGDRDFSRVIAGLSHHETVEDTARWLPWLDDLAAYSLEAVTLSYTPPTLLIHGTEDAIVPFAQAAQLATKLPHATLDRWEGVGHAPHVHDVERVQKAIAAHRARYQE